MVGFLTESLVVALLCFQAAVAVRFSLGDPPTTSGTDPLPLLKFGGISKSYEQVGFEHGSRAGDRIHKFLATRFIRDLKRFRDSAGRIFFEQLVKTNAAAFPEYASEISGIAAGAKADPDDIWMLNLMGEIAAAKRYKMPENTTFVISGCAPSETKKITVVDNRLVELTQPEQRVECDVQEDHCSTFASRFEGELALGHTEDWSAEFVNIIYLQDVVYPSGTHLAGFGYPGQILGFAIVSNSHGLFFTQNSVWPKRLEDGLGLTFVSRRAMDEATIQEAVEKLQVGHLAWGISVNIISLADMRGANVEVSHGGSNGRSNIQWIAESGQYFVHFNEFRRLAGENGVVSSTSRDRGNHQSSLGPPQSVDDLKRRMCFAGTVGKLDAIYRPTTMMTWLVLKSGSKKASALVWHGVSACDGKPMVINLPPGN